MSVSEYHNSHFAFENKTIFAFDELFDVNEFQHLQDIFSEANGITSIIVLSNGNPITKVSNLKALITKDNTLPIFDEIDYNPQIRSYIDGCLLKSSVAITVNNQHIANWMIGQVRNENFDLEKVIMTIESKGIDGLSIIKELRQMPQMSKTKFDSITKLLQVMVDELGENAFANYQLKNNLDKHQIIIKTAMDGFWVLDMQGNIVEVNDAYCKISGYTTEELLKMKATEIEVEEDITKLLNHINTIKTKGEDAFESRHRRKDGKIVDVEINVQYKDIDGGIMVAFIKDITSQKESRRLLIQNEQRLEQAMAATSDAMWEWDYVTGVTHYSHQWFKMLGYEDNELEMSVKTFEELCHPADLQSTLEKIYATLYNPGSKSYYAEFRMKHKNGTWKWVLGRGNVVKRDENQNPLLLSGTNTDITERKLIEEELRESEEKFRNLVWALQVGVIVQNAQSEIIMSNPKALELLGLSEDELLSRTAYNPEWNIVDEDGNSFIGENLPVPVAITTKQSVRNIVMGLYRPLHHDRVWIVVDAVPQLDVEGVVKQVVCSFKDITQQKNAEFALRKSKKFLKETQKIASLGTYSLDVKTGMWESSEVLDTIFGIETTYDKTIYGWNFIIHPEWQNIMNTYFTQEVVGKKQDFNKEYKIVRKNDNIERWVHGLGRLVFNETGEPIKMIGTIRDITECKEAEEKLLQEQLFSKKLLDSLPGIFYLYTYPDLKLVLWNKNHETLLGYEADEMRNRYIMDWHIPQADQAVQTAVDYVMDVGYNVLESPLMSKDGRYVPFLMTGVRFEMGNQRYLMGIGIDITERKKDEETIKTTKLLLEQTIEQSPVPIVLISMPDATIRMMNTACVKFLGIEDEPSYINLPINELVPTWKDYDVNGNPGKTEDLPIFKSLMGVKTEGEERSLVTKFGEKHIELVSAYPIKDDKGNIIAGYLMIMDITERKKAELALKESREKFMKIFDLAPVLISISNYNDGTYIDVNSYALIISGFTRDEVVGHKPVEIGWLKQEDRLKLVNMLYETGRIDKLELPFRTKQGDVFWGLINGERIVIDNQDCILTITTDITERKKIEFLLKEINEEIETQNEEYLQINEELLQTNEELQYAKEKAEESDRLKSAFLANMSHEIRTPMNGILGFTELLKEPHLTGEKRQQCISIIEKSGARMLNIINDIISISKIESGLVEVVQSLTNINEQIEYIYTFFKPEAEQNGIELYMKNSLPSKEVTIITDREKVYAILTNLVKNALKFTHAGSIELGYYKKDSMLEFYVKDTGEGILPEQKAIIFERFRQGSESLNRNYEGAGLGLSISKAYVEMLGGTIWVESEPRKGATFYFTLPIQKDEYEKYDLPKQEPVLLNNRSFSRRLKTLVVEDDVTSEMLIVLDIQSICREILIAKTGLEAIDLVKKNDDIDLILMDNKMAEMDSIEATKEIRTINKEVVIIAQTAFALHDERDKMINAGCNDYISKPFNQSSLLSIIKKYFK